MYFVHYQSEDSHVHFIGLLGAFEHLVQFLVNRSPFLCPFLDLSCSYWVATTINILMSVWVVYSNAREPIPVLINNKNSCGPPSF